MGAECCGGSKTSTADAAAKTDFGPASERLPAHDESKSWEQIAAEKKSYYDHRVSMFEEIKAKYQAAVAEAKEKNEEITVTMPDGSERKAVKGATTPMDIATEISKGLAKKSVVAKVNGKVWDLMRPLEGDCSLELLSFDHPDGKDTFWHSSSHLLGQALELEFGADLTIGPALEEGFYYDCYLGERSLQEPDKERLIKRMQSSVKEKHTFERVQISKEEAKKMFTENKFKMEMIEALPASEVITCYKCGPMVDLCTGPHVPNTGVLKAVGVNNMSRAFWRADVNREPLQRVYGITFPDDKELKAYQHRMEEAKKRDHRNIGTQQELFFFDAVSPGSCFFMPHGARIYNTLVDFIREKYWDYGYEEVVSPNIYNFSLWDTSGHADHYKQNMFSFQVERQEFGLKPMNCPGHCVMFGHRMRSYRELPIRMADFGVLHRNEYSGALSGLTRVRRFQQDDAHIFCKPDQVREEISSFLKMLDEVYHVFGLEYKMALSTRPEGFLGEESLWDQAEASLEQALNDAGHEWELNPGDGAFYGPKIDITVFDALKRKFQCATVQLDFQLPIRFDLEYIDEHGEGQRPTTLLKTRGGAVQTSPGFSWQQTAVTFVATLLTIATVTWLNTYLVSTHGKDVAVLLGPFGALVTLLYGLTAAPASQPRNAILGQTVSVGTVLLLQYIPRWESMSIEWRAALSTALAVSAMVRLGFIHPPAGAAALLFALDPDFLDGAHFAVLLLANAVAIGMAVILNNLSDHRQYPTYWGVRILSEAAKLLQTREKEQEAKLP